MDKDLHNIEDLFQSALDNNEEMPSAKVWDAVDTRLDKEYVTSIKKKYNNLKRFSLLLLLLLICFGIYELTGWPGNHPSEKNYDPANSIVSEKENNKKIAVDKSSSSAKELNTISPLTSSQYNPSGSKPPSINSSEQIPIAINEKDQLPVNVKNSKSAGKNNFTATEEALLIINQQGKVSKTGKTGIGKEIKEDKAPGNAGEINNFFPFTNLYTIAPAEKIYTSPEKFLETKTMSQSITNGTRVPVTISNTPAQSNNKKSTSSRFSITGFFSPDRASYQLENDEQNNQPASAAQIKKTETHEFSSSAGLLVDYMLNRKWSLQSGLTFSNTNISIQPQTLYAEADNTGNIKYRFNLSSGYGYILPGFQNNPAVGDSVYASAAEHKLRYLSVPLAAKYTLTNGKLKIELMAGTGINFLTKGKLETEIQRGLNNEIDVVNNIQGLKSIYVNGLAGLNAEIKITKNISFMVMPTARGALIPINKGASVKTYPNSFGVASGLKIRL